MTAASEVRTPGGSDEAGPHRRPPRNHPLLARPDFGARGRARSPDQIFLIRVTIRGMCHKLALRAGAESRNSAPRASLRPRVDHPRGCPADALFGRRRAFRSVPKRLPRARPSHSPWYPARGGQPVSAPAVFDRGDIALELSKARRCSRSTSQCHGAAGSCEYGWGGAMCVILPLCAVAAALVLVSLASAAAQPAAEATYRARVQEYEAKSFPSMVTLNKGETAQGFVFFVLPEPSATGGRDSSQAPMTSGRTFDEAPQSGDYRFPPPSQRAVVANMAGSIARPMILHVEAEDGLQAPAASGGPNVTSATGDASKTIHLRLALGP